MTNFNQFLCRRYSPEFIIILDVVIALILIAAIKEWLNKRYISHFQMALEMIIMVGFLFGGVYITLVRFHLYEGIQSIVGIANLALVIPATLVLCVYNYVKIVRFDAYKRRKLRRCLVGLVICVGFLVAVCYSDFILKPFINFLKCLHIM